MNITGASIRNNRVTLVAIAVLVLAGALAYRSMPRQLDPGFIIRAAQIVTVFPGASPERVEQLVTDPIEEAVQEIPELDFVQSESRTGLSVVTIMIREEYRKMRPIWDNLRRKVDRIRSDLPSGIIGPNVNDEFGDTYGIVFTISGDGFDYAELKEAADQIRDDLLRVQDVAKVQIMGAQEERIFVEYNNARLANLGLSPAALANLLEARNIIMPGGDISLEREK
ncbi:MAG: efflux RND transporter permease subunit, partial [Myxococcales bacterium]|nr:efflux RND transporter permease subunit [Myxococcales bacterium]